MTHDKAQHTPGPFSFCDVINVKGVKKSIGVLAPNPLKAVALTGFIGDEDEEESRANARLFAAAPELKDMVAWLSNILDFIDDFRGTQAFKGTIADARALLAKIEGE